MLSLCAKATKPTTLMLVSQIDGPDFSIIGVNFPH